MKEEKEELYLYVFENNYGAVQFYQNRGFVNIETSVNEDLGEIEYLMYSKNNKEEEV